MTTSRDLGNPHDHGHSQSYDWDENDECHLLYNDVEYLWYCLSLPLMLVSHISYISAIVIFCFITTFGLGMLTILIREADWHNWTRTLSIISLVVMVLSCTVSRITYASQMLATNEHTLFVHYLYGLGTVGLCASSMNLVLIIFKTTTNVFRKPFFLNIVFVIGLYAIYAMMGVSMELLRIILIDNKPTYLHHIMYVHHLMRGLLQYLTMAGALVAARNLKMNLKASRSDMYDPHRHRLKSLYVLTLCSALVAGVLGTVCIFRANDNGIYSADPFNHRKNPLRYLVTSIFLWVADAGGCIVVLMGFMNTNRASSMRKTFGTLSNRMSRGRYNLYSSEFKRQHNTTENLTTNDGSTDQKEEMQLQAVSDSTLCNKSTAYYVS